MSLFSWPKGESPCLGTGHYRARRIASGPDCERCGKDGRTDIHHKDGNPLNNIRTNLERLCRRCHMEADGRLAKTRTRMKGLTGEAHPACRYTDDQISAMRDLHRAGLPVVAIAKALGVSARSVRHHTGSRSETRTPLTPELCIAIQRRWASGAASSLRQLGREFGMSHSQVTRALSKRSGV